MFYNAYMPCADRQRLEVNLRSAIWADARALDPGVQVARSMSDRKRHEKEREAHRGLVSAEFQINSHIAACSVCQAEGQKPHYNFSEARR